MTLLTHLLCFSNQKSQKPIFDKNMFESPVKTKKIYISFSRKTFSSPRLRQNQIKKHFPTLNVMFDWFHLSWRLYKHTKIDIYRKITNIVQLKPNSNPIKYVCHPLGIISSVVAAFGRESPRKVLYDTQKDVFLQPKCYEFWHSVFSSEAPVQVPQ